MNVKPLHDHVIVLRCAGEDTTTEAGIVLPGASGESKPEQGIVVGVGPGRLTGTGFEDRVAMSVKEGDHVLFGKFNGQTINIGPHQYLVMRDSDIYGVLCQAEEG
jgi:chaperonin GroES